MNAIRADRSTVERLSPHRSGAHAMTSFDRGNQRSSGNCVLAVAPEASLLSSQVATDQRHSGWNGKAVQSAALS